MDYAFFSFLRRNGSSCYMKLFYFGAVCVVARLLIGTELSHYYGRSSHSLLRNATGRCLVVYDVHKSVCLNKLCALML